MNGIQNGKLLALAEKSFDVFITMDGNIQFQQNYSNLKLILIALKAQSNRLADTEPLVAKLVTLLPTLKPGTLTVVL